jgi:phosphotransacetylase
MTDGFLFDMFVVKELDIQHVKYIATGTAETIFRFGINNPVALCT